MEVSSDGRTVWVQSPRACMARFCPASAEYQDEDGMPRDFDVPPDWDRFVEKVGEFYGVAKEAMEPHRPKWVE